MQPVMEKKSCKTISFNCLFNVLGFSFSVSATRVNTRQKTKSSLHKNTAQSSKRNLINQQFSQAAKPVWPGLSASNLGAKIQPPNGYTGAWKGIFVSGQHVPQATQPITSQKDSRPAQIYQGVSVRDTASNESRYLSNAKATTAPKSSPFITKVPIISPAGINF